MLEVLRAGPLTTVQDLGRPGYADLGVPRSGALDAPARRAGNALVGNPPDAAGLEVTLTGCRVRPRHPVWLAVTGAPAEIRVDGEQVPFGAPVRVAAGSIVHIGRCIRGVRSYLAVAGGIDVPPVLGSRATDTLSGLGPQPVRDGDLLPLGAASSTVDEHATVPAAEAPSTVELRIRRGPRDGWFTGDSWELLCGSRYQISPSSNRIGVRLSGAALTRAVAGELPSEGLVLGAVQVPASGQPLVFLADHPTTGGYPVVAVVHPDDVPLLAQARPGASVVFHGSERGSR